MAKSASEILRRNDRTTYEGIMPKRTIRGRNSGFDWEARDRQVHSQIARIAESLGANASSVGRVLAHCGFAKVLFEKARGRLPRSKGLAFALVDAWRRKSDRQTCFHFLCDLDLPSTSEQPSGDH